MAEVDLFWSETDRLKNSEVRHAAERENGEICRSSSQKRSRETAVSVYQSVLANVKKIYIKKKKTTSRSLFQKETICFQSRTRIRTSSLYTGQWSSLVFLCRGIPKPCRRPFQTTSPASCTGEMIGRQKAESDGAAVFKESEGKSSRTSISIREKELEMHII